jgi:hypothetical protein
MSNLSNWRSAAKQFASRLTTIEKISLGLTVGVLVISPPLAVYGFSTGQQTLGVLNTITPLLFMARSGEIFRSVRRRGPTCG